MLILFCFSAKGALAKSNDSTHKQENAIRGMWEDKDSKVEFFKDGSCMWLFLSCNYAFVDDNRLKIDFNGPFGRSTRIFQTTISGNELILRSEDEVIKLKRVKIK
jgi:hypothetical protein